MKEIEMVEFEDVTITEERPLSIKCNFQDSTVAWVPKSLIGDDSEVWGDGDEGTLVIPEWYAIKEGLV